MHSPLLTKPVFTQSKVEPKRQASRQPRFTFWAGLALMVIILAVAVLYARGVFVRASSRTVAPRDREKPGATTPSHRMSLPFQDTNARA